MNQPNNRADGKTPAGSPRRRRKAGASRPSSGHPTPAPVAAGSAAQAGPINKATSRPSKNNKSKNRSDRPNQRQRRRTLGDIMAAEYQKPDLGGIVARATTPREVMLALSPADAQRILDALHDRPGSADISAYISTKIVWTEKYNASLSS